MDLVELLLRLMNIPVIKKEKPGEYFSRVKKLLEENKYFVSESGLIFGREDHPEDYLGDIRASKSRVIISPNKMYLRTEALMLTDLLISEKIPFEHKEFSY